MTINNNSTGASLRLNTRASQPRTSSNSSFQDQFRSGLRSGIDMSKSAVDQVSRGIPGGAMLSASLSDAARNLNGPSGLAPVSASSEVTDGSDSGEALEEKMAKKNNDYLEQQMRISQITTAYSTKSYILKAMFDSLKTIGSNIR